MKINFFGEGGMSGNAQNGDDETSYSKGRRGKTLTGKERVLRKKKGKIVLKMAKSPCFITTKNNNNNNKYKTSPKNFPPLLF